MNLLFPSASVVAERLCFQRRLSFCPQGGEVYNPWSDPLGTHTPDRHLLDRHPPWQTATAADGTRPTGMHFCLHLILKTGTLDILT